MKRSALHRVGMLLLWSAGAVFPADAEGERLDVSGTLSLGASYNEGTSVSFGSPGDYEGFSMFRPRADVVAKLSLHPRWKATVQGLAAHDLIYSLKGRSHFSQDAVREFEHDYQLGEAYVDGRVGESLDLRLGRQVIVWGKADVLRVVDVLNPLDNRTIGLTSLKDLRLPVGMMRMDVHRGPSSLSVIAVPEVRFSRLPPAGGEFAPGPEPYPPERTPPVSLRNTGWAASFSSALQKIEVGLHWARLLDDRRHLESLEQSPVLSHGRVNVLGASGTLVHRDWLFMAEAAYLSGLRYTFVPERRKRLDLLLGVELAPWSGHLLGVEVANRHLFDYTPELDNAVDQAERNAGEIALRYNGSFRRETLRVELIATWFGHRFEKGGIQRVTAEQDLAEGLSVGGGIALYQRGHNPYLGYLADNDRAFVELKYSFSRRR